MNYFDQLEMLDKAIGFGSERDDVLVYAENETMFSIHNRNDVDMRNANAIAGFIPLGQITRFTATKPGEGTKIVCVLHIPPCYEDTAGLRNRMAQGIFKLASDVTDCCHTDFATETMWLCERKQSEVSLQTHGGAEPQMPAKVRPTIGRNDPCPCGSGVKWKKCCMGVNTAKLQRFPEVPL